MNRPLPTAALALTTALALGLVGCATTPAPRVASGPAGPQVTAAMLGPVIGGRPARAAAAGVPPLANGAVAAVVDRLEADLRQRTAGTGVEVVRQGYNLDLRMPSGVAFDFNAATVKAKFRSVLDAVAQTLAAVPATLIDVTGYTDALGTDAVNQRLSDERAAAVADYLGARGVGRARIAARGLGKAQPIASNADAAGRAANRRVEIHVSPVIEEDVRGRRR